MKWVPLYVSWHISLLRGTGHLIQLIKQLEEHCMKCVKHLLKYFSCCQNHCYSFAFLGHIQIYNFFLNNFSPWINGLEGIKLNILQLDFLQEKRKLCFPFSNVLSSKRVVRDLRITLPQTLLRSLKDFACSSKLRKGATANHNYQSPSPTKCACWILGIWTMEDWNDNG